MALLDVDRLVTSFFTARGEVRVLRGLDFSVDEGEIIGLVGETGSGKSVTALSILRLLPKAGAAVSGQILFEGRDLLQLSEKEMVAVRGAKIAMIFQNPRECLNPTMRVGNQLRLVYQARGIVEAGLYHSEAVRMLRELGLPDPERTLRAYPHELSGGMCQRVMIALALACSPQLLIADEATTGLDVTIQLQLIRILKSLRDQKGLTEIIITHDLGIVAEMCDRVAVMYTGDIVESGPVSDVFAHPRHPYTVGLLAARPRIGTREEIRSMPGRVPNLLNLPSGCPFRTRCGYALEECSNTVPPTVDVQEGHQVKCFLSDGRGLS